MQYKRRFLGPPSPIHSHSTSTASLLFAMGFPLSHDGFIHFISFILNTILQQCLGFSLSARKL